jgi:hypothetical protein
MNSLLEKSNLEIIAEGMLDISSSPSHFNSYVPQNIDRKIRNSKFFIFPNDKIFTPLNCFEQNSHLYFMMAEKLPELKPQLVNIKFDQVNLHSSVLFENNSKVFLADPIWKYLGPIEISNSKISYVNNMFSNESFNNFKYDTMGRFSNSTLREIINNLNSEKGIVDYLFQSGQVVSRLYDFPYRKELFMHIDNELKVHGQIRIIDCCASKDNSLIRIKYDPFSEDIAVDTFAFSTLNWQKVNNQRLIHSKERENHKDLEISKEVATYLVDTKFSFQGIKNKSEGLGTFNEFKHTREISEDFYNYYVNFLEKNNYDYTQKKSQKTSNDLERLVQGLKIGTERAQTSIDMRTVFQLLRLSYDFKKYCKEIKRVIY